MITGAVNLIPEEPIARMVHLAQLAESHGYRRCWIYDEGLATRDVYVTMAAIASATGTLEVGPGITNPFTRHVGVTAAAVASVDELSGGRAFLGLGAGGSLTLGPLGIERTKPLSAVREAIAACRALFSGRPVTTDPGRVTLVDATLGYARPDIEIWLAGRGPKMLALGGGTCDGVMLDFIHKPSLGHVIDLVREGGRRTGNEARISYSTAIVTDSASMEALKPHMTYRLVDAPPDVKDAIGLTDADASRIASAMSDGLEAAARHVEDDWVLPFVFSGTPDECSAELEDVVAEHGIDEFLLPVLDDEKAEEQIETVAAVLGLAGG